MVYSQNERHTKGLQRIGEFCIRFKISNKGPNQDD